MSSPRGIHALIPTAHRRAAGETVTARDPVPARDAVAARDPAPAARASVSREATGGRPPVPVADAARADAGRADVERADAVRPGQGAGSVTLERSTVDCLVAVLDDVAGGGRPGDQTRQLAVALAALLRGTLENPR